MHMCISDQLRPYRPTDYCKCMYPYTVEHERGL
jgi:hypothetical protein